MIANASTPASERKQPETFCFELGHADIAFSQVVVKGNTQVDDEAQDLVAVLA